MEFIYNKKRMLWDYYTMDDIDYPEDPTDDRMIIKGRKYTVYLTMNERVPDSECCRVRIKGKLYYFG